MREPLVNRQFLAQTWTRILMYGQLGRLNGQVQWPVANAVINDAIDMRRVEFEGLLWNRAGVRAAQEKWRKVEPVKDESENISRTF